MSFQESACGYQLSKGDGATFLEAICNNEEGTGLMSDILLDEYIGNLDGELAILAT